MQGRTALSYQAQLARAEAEGIIYRYEGHRYVRAQYEDHPYLQCMTLFIAVVLIVLIETTVIVYSDGRKGAPEPKAQVYSVRPRIDIRFNLGLDIDNETSGGRIAFMGAESNVTLHLFTEEYTEMCERYFVQRAYHSDSNFKNFFHSLKNLTRPRLKRESQSYVKSALTSSNISHPHHNITNSLSSNRVLSNHPRILGATRTDNKPLCPCVPVNSLVGDIQVDLDVPHLGAMELDRPDIQAGGHWSPPSCLARHRTAIIIPFRDREEHLTILLNYLHPFLQRQQLYYTIFVVEQVYPAVFNKASIMNVGFIEATLADSYDCFIFHDVDMIPQNDYNFYTCTTQPRHVGSHLDKFNYEVPYENVFGGVTAFTGEQFNTVNGFSNDFYGWGGEDDDMYQRVRAANLSVVRFPGNIARYTMIKHGADEGNPYNNRATVGLSPRVQHYQKSGLNSLRYYIPKRENRPLYTWMSVELPDRVLTEIYIDSNGGARTYIASYRVLLISVFMYSFMAFLLRS